MPGIAHAPDEIYAPLRRGGEGPAPGVFDQIGAAFRSNRDDQPGHMLEEKMNAYAPLIEELRKANGQRVERYYNTGRMGDPVYEATVWADIAAERRRNPEFLKAYGNDAASFRKIWEPKVKARMDKDTRIVERSGWVPWLIGSFGGGLTDPTTLIPGGGAGKTALQIGLRQAALNATVEVAMQPLIAAERAKTGRELTVREAALNVGASGLLGFGLGAGSKLAGDHVVPKIGEGWSAVKSLSKDMQEAAWAQVIDKVPGLKAKMAGKVDWDALDDHLPEVVEGLVGRENLSVQERTAVDMLRREAEIDAANPFRADGAGIAKHRALFEANIQRTYDDIARLSRPSNLAQAGDGPLSSSTALQSRTIVVPGKSGQIGYANDIYQFFRGKGLTDAQARGIAAGIHAESASNHNIRGGYKGRALGLGQWLGPRRAEIIRRFGPNPTRQQQLEFLFEELQGRDPGGPKVLAKADEAEVLRSYIVDFMRPAKGPQTTGDMKRGMQALGRGGETMTLREEADGVAVAEGADFDPEAVASAELARRGKALDAERAALAEAQIDVQPELRRDLFPDENSWRVAQAAVEADELGIAPVVTRQTIWEDARAQLQAAKGGEVPGALYHPDLGPIDVKWGNAKGGLQHISAKHPEVLDDLPALIEEMEIVGQRAGRVDLESMDHSATVRLDWDDKAQHWLLTAFQREEPKARAAAIADGGEGAPTPAVSSRAGDGAGASPTAGAMRDIALNERNIKLAEGVGDFARYWDASVSRGEMPKPIWAVVDKDGQVRGWETNGNRAARQMERRGIEGGRVERIDAPADPDGAPVLLAMDERYADPAGPEMKLQAERLTHDLKNAAETDAIAYRLGDGDERSITDVLEVLDAEDAAIAAIRGCL